VAITSGAKTGPGSFTPANSHRSLRAGSPFTAILPDQKHTSAIRFFHMTRAHFSRFGFSCRRVLTDNGSCYRDGRFRMLLNQQHLKHRTVVRSFLLCLLDAGGIYVLLDNRSEANFQRYKSEDFS
jgi:hypothetical protein